MMMTVRMALVLAAVAFGAAAAELQSAPLPKPVELVPPAAGIAKDADQLELLLMLKKLGDLGNTHVSDWIAPLLARLKTEAGKQLAQEILSTRWDEWWFGDKKDSHWVDGNRHKLLD